MKRSGRRRNVLGPLAALGGVLGAGVGLYHARARMIARMLKLPPARYSVGVDKDLRVPGEAGRVLLANHYYPKANGDFPTILIRSPWGRGLEALPFSTIYWLIANIFAERGYHVLVQNTRVRTDAEGELFPWGEAEDGRAAAEWIGAQSWFNGKLGMWGASYLGYAGWALAADAPDYVQALVPVTTTSNWRAFFYHDNALALERILTTLGLLRSAKEPLRKMMANGKAREAAYAAAVQHLPLADADRVLTGDSVTSWRWTLERPDPADPFWGPLQHRDELAGVKAEVHLFGGWHDIFLRETIADYDALVAADHKPYLTIGPYTHTSPDVGWESVRQALVWFDATLRDKRAGLRTRPVRVFVEGADEWREFDNWPPPSEPQRFRLQGGGVLVTQDEAKDGEPDRFRYDPANPTPAVGGALIGAGGGSVDDAPLESRSDVLCYTTPALTADLDVVGPVMLDLYAQSSAPTTDFFSRLCDVDTKGISHNVCDGFIRLNFEAGPTDEPRAVRIELGPTAYRFQKGHCLRLVIASGAHPRWNRNPGVQDVNGTSTELRPAEQTVYHDTAYPSAITLPVATVA